MRWLFALIPCAIFGCGYNPGVNPDAVDVEARVTLAGKSVNDVNLNLQPTGTGTQAVIPVKNGVAKGPVTPGKYTYYLSEGKKAASFASVPEKYRAGLLDRQIEIKSAGSIEFVFD